MASNTTDYRRAVTRSTMFANHRKYCSSCWRDEMHTPKQAAYFVQIVVVLLTFGLGLFFWPFRCTCCGTIRPNWFRTYIPFFGRKGP